jgi:hypothetical protein
MRPILWFLVNARALPLDYTTCNAQNCWSSVDALLMSCWCSVDALLTLWWRCFHTLLTLIFSCNNNNSTGLHMQAATSSMIDRSRSLAVGLYPMQHPKLLTLCWHPDLSVATLMSTILTITKPNTPIMGTSRSTALGLYKMQQPQFVTLCWRSFSEWGCEHVNFSFSHEGCQ